MAKKKEEKELRPEVYQSNPMIEARKHFSLTGMRIFFLGLRGVNPHFSSKDKFYDEKFDELFIPTAKLIELFGGNTFYLKDLKAECKKLFDSIVEINYPNGGFVLMHMFRRAEYIPKEGLYIQFDELMRPYLLDLLESKGYTKISVEQIFKLSSPYAVRLLELLLQYQNIPSMKANKELIRKFQMDELRFVLNVPDGAYEGKMCNFREKVLNTPIAEINKKTFYKMSYSVIKEGRKVVGFEIHMDMSKVPEMQEEEIVVPTSYEKEMAMRKLTKLGFTEQAAVAIYSKCKDAEDCIKRADYAYQALEKQKRKKPVNNDLGFIRKAIEENWRLKEIEGNQVKSQRAIPPPVEEVLKKTERKRPTEEDLAAYAKECGTDISAFREGEKPFSPSLYQDIVKRLQAGRTRALVDSILKHNGLTLARFKEIYNVETEENSKDSKTEKTNSA